MLLCIAQATFNVSKLSKLVKEVNCQYTFGVYTRWDECIERIKSRADGSASLEDLRKEYKENYSRMIATGTEDKDLVYFVNVKSVQEIKVSVSL